MLCYRDKTYCVNYKCKKKNKCKDYLTEQIKLDAERIGIPIAMANFDCEENNESS